MSFFGGAKNTARQVAQPVGTTRGLFAGPAPAPTFQQAQQVALAAAMLGAPAPARTLRVPTAPIAPLFRQVAQPAQQAATWMTPERESQLFDQQMQLTHLQQNPAFGVNPFLNAQGDKINQSLELMRQPPAPNEALLTRAALLMEVKRKYPDLPPDYYGTLTNEQLAAMMDAPVISAVNADQYRGGPKPATPTPAPYGYGAASPPRRTTQEAEVPSVTPSTSGGIGSLVGPTAVAEAGRDPRLANAPDYGQMDAAWLQATDNRDPKGVQVLGKEEGQIAREIASGAWRSPQQSMELVQLQAQAANLQNQINKGFDPNDPNGPADIQQLRDTLARTNEQIGVLQDGPNRQPNGLLPGVVMIAGDASELMDAPRAWQAEELGDFAIQVAQGDPYESAVDLLNSTVAIAGSAIDWAAHLGDKDWADTFAGWVKDPNNWSTILSIAQTGYGTLNLDTNGDGKIDTTTKAFYGGRAVWEYYIGLQGKGSRAVYDIAIDPTVYGTLATSALYGVGKGVATRGLEGLATESGAGATAANIARIIGGGVAMAPEAIINKSIDAPLGFIGGLAGDVIRSIPGVSKLPELSDQAAEELAQEEAVDILNHARGVGVSASNLGGPPPGASPNPPSPLRPPGVSPAPSEALTDTIPETATAISRTTYLDLIDDQTVAVVNTTLPPDHPLRSVTFTDTGDQLVANLRGINQTFATMDDALRAIQDEQESAVAALPDRGIDIPAGVAPPEPQIVQEAEEAGAGLFNQAPTPNPDVPQPQVGTSPQSAVPADAADAPADLPAQGPPTQLYDPDRPTFAADIAEGVVTPSTPRASGTRVVDQAVQLAQTMPADGEGRLTYFTQVVDGVQQQTKAFVTDLDAQIAEQYPNVSERFVTQLDGFKTTKNGEPLFQEVGSGRVVANQPPAMAVVPQEIQSVTNVVDEYIPAFNDAFGQMPNIAPENVITAPRWERIDNPGAKVAFTDENPRWLVQRAAFGSDAESAEAIMALQRLGRGIPNLPDLIDQLRGVHRRFINLVENGPPPPWSAPSPPIGRDVLGFKSPSIRDMLTDVSDYAAGSVPPKFTNAMPPDIVAGLRTGAFSQEQADFLSQVVTLDADVGRFGKGTKISVYDLVKEYESAGVMDAEDANLVITTLMRDQDLLPSAGLRVRENPKAKPAARWEVRDAQDKTVKAFKDKSAAEQFARRDGDNAVLHHAGEAYKNTQQMFRENVMYNLVSGPAAANRDMISNAFWMAGNGDLTGAARAMKDYAGQFLNFLTPGRKIDMSGTLQRGAAPFERTGSTMPSTWKESVNNFGLFGGDTPIIQRITPTKAGKRGASVLANVKTKNLRQGADVISRDIFGPDMFVKHVGEERIDWLLYTRSRLEGILPPADVDRIMAQLGDTGDLYQGVRLFSPDEVRAALDGQIPNGKIEHLQRRWRQSLTKATGLAKKDVDKALYSYKYTRADELVGNLLIFHYWMSRSLINNARVFKDNPWMIRTAYEIQQYMNESSDIEGLPPWSRGVLKFWGNGGTYLWFMDPISLVLPWAAAREVAMSDGGIDNLKDFDALMQFVGISPLIQFAASTMGFTDPYRAVDITGTTSVRGAVTAGADFVRNWILPEYAGDTSHMGLSVANDPIALVERAVTNGISSWMSEHGVPFSNPTELPPVDASQVRRVNENIFDAVLEAHGITWDEFTAMSNPDGSLTEEQRAILNEVAVSMKTVGTDSPDQYAQAAMQAETITQGIKRVINSTSPAQVQTSYGPQITRTELASQNRDADWNGTKAQQAASAVESVVTSANPVQTSIFDGSYEVGTPRQREISGVYNDLANADDAELNEAYGPMAMIEIGGTTYWLDQLQYMSEDERYALADQWAKENGYTADLDSLKAEKDAYREANPEMAAFKTWQTRQSKYPGGQLAARDAMMAANPNYAEYINHLKPADRENFTKIFGVDAYLAWTGYADSIYDPNQNPDTGQQGTIDYLAGLIEGDKTGGSSGSGASSASKTGEKGATDTETPRTPNAATQTATATKPEDVQDVQSLQIDEEKYNSDRDQYNAAVQELFGADYSELSKEDQRIAREEFGPYPSATSTLKKYYNWRDQQLELDPDADVSFDAYVLSDQTVTDAKTDSKTQEKIGKAVRALQIDEQEYYEDTQLWDQAAMSLTGGIPWEQIDKDADEYLYDLVLDQIGKRPKATGDLKKYWDWRDQMVAVNPDADVSMEAYYNAQYDGTNTLNSEPKPDTGHTGQKPRKGLNVRN